MTNHMKFGSTLISDPYWNMKKTLETTSQTLLVGWGQSHGNHVNVPQQPVLGQGQKPAPNLPKANGDGWKFWYQWTH